MRAYISGRYEGNADEIYISEAFFTGENEYEEDWPYDEGKHIFAGVWCEFSTDPKEKTFAGRWKGCTVDEEDEEHTVYENVLEAINGRRLNNISLSLEQNSDVKIYIDEFEINYYDEVEKTEKKIVIAENDIDVIKILNM